MTTKARSGLVVQARRSSRRPDRSGLVAVLLCATSLAAEAQPRDLRTAPPDADAGRPAASAECVTLGSARLGVKYEFRYSDGRGTVSTSTTEYLAVSGTSVQLRLTQGGPAGMSGATETVTESIQRVVDDLLVIEKTVSSGTGPRGRTRNTVTYSPPMIGDPAARVCGGRTWTIPSVTVSTTASPGTASQARTDPGTGRVIAVRETVTVPAGTFQTVHYEKTFTGQHGRVVLEFWRSITDGVSVKYTYRAAGAVATQVLTAIR